MSPPTLLAPVVRFAPRPTGLLHVGNVRGETFWLAVRGNLTILADTKIWVASGRKGRALFHPLRLAPTAHENGPEMARLLPLNGRANVAARLAGKAG